MIGVISFVIVAFYSFLVSNASKPFNCKLQPDGTYTMAKSPSERCFTGKWNQYSGLSYIFLIVYGLFFPAGLAISFVRYRKNLDHSEFRRKFGHLVSSYKRRFFFWELVLMLKKAGFSSINDFLGSSPYGTRYFVSISWICCFMWLELLLSPYVVHHFNAINHT